MTTKTMRDKLAVLREAGLEVLEVLPAKGTHKKVRVRTPAGHEATIVVADSRSCVRALLNLRTDARRIAAGQPTNGRHDPSDRV